MSTETDLEQMMAHVMSVIKLLPSRTKILAKDCFHEDFWDGIPMSIHKELGRHIAELVKQGSLPLSPAGRGGNNHRQYIVL